MFQTIVPVTLDPTVYLGSASMAFSWGSIPNAVVVGPPAFTGRAVNGIVGNEVGALAGMLVWLNPTTNAYERCDGIVYATQLALGFCFSYTDTATGAGILNVPSGHVPPAYGMDRSYPIQVALVNTVCLAKGPSAKYLTDIYATCDDLTAAIDIRPNYVVGAPLRRSKWGVLTVDAATAVATGPIIGYISNVQTFAGSAGSSMLIEFESRI